MKSIPLRTQNGVTIAPEFPERAVQASTAELFSLLHPRVNDSSHLPENPKLAELLAQQIGNGRWQALHLDHSLANENHLSDFSNSGDPGVTDQLRIKSQQSSGSSEDRLAAVFHSIRQCVPSTLPIEPM